ncbi:MAG TPA: PrgI family protein [Candidatus Eisenbacteria bacterium]|nr:PrgI family protein [Candidatus Eisenbacteria bacterium]
MDNHPIPQDVTGFQFRLIGDMTIKQFAYLAAGIVLAWICLSLPLFFLLKLPLIVLFGGSGIILAFVPIGGRPADTMILYFFKAVFSPTQYTYKSHSDPSPTAAVGNNLPVQEEKKEEKKDEKIHLAAPTAASSFDQLFGDQKKAEQPTEEVTPAVAEPVPTAAIAETSNPSQLAQETTTLTKALAEADKEETTVEKSVEEAKEAHQKATDLETELQAIHEQKQILEAKLLELQKQLAQKPQQVFSPSTAPTPQATENVRKIPPSLGKSVGTPFVSDVPNLICGIVKDPRGNVLPNILIEVKDKDGNPVRAFKTNPLGQFASATPVINGIYTITFEDPNAKQRFDTIEMQADGEVLQPLEVISIDAREDLRKELFGG